MSTIASRHSALATKLRSRCTTSQCYSYRTLWTRQKSVIMQVPGSTRSRITQRRVCGFRHSQSASSSVWLHQQPTAVRCLLHKECQNNYFLGAEAYIYKPCSLPCRQIECGGSHLLTHYDLVTTENQMFIKYQIANTLRSFTVRLVSPWLQGNQLHVSTLRNF